MSEENGKDGKRGIINHEHVAYSRLTSGVFVARSSDHEIVRGDNGEPLLVLALEGVNGSFRFIMDLRHAVGLGRNLLRTSREADASSIKLAKPSDLGRLPGPPE